MRKFILLVLLFVFVTGCAPVMLTLPYTPVTTAEIDGGVKVELFGYFPSQGVQPNQIENTAAGTILLTENVSDFFTNAVKRELRQAGVSLRDSCRCTLTGEINKFLIDDLGFTCSYVTDIRYILKDYNDLVIFDNNYIVKFNTSKFVVMEIIYANLNKVVSDNIGQLLSDDVFRSIIVEKCQIL